MRYNDPTIHLIEQDYLIWYHENKSVMWHVSSSAPCKYDVSKYLHFSLETEIGTMDDDSNAVINKEQRKWTYGIRTLTEEEHKCRFSLFMSFIYVRCRYI